MAVYFHRCLLQFYEEIINAIPSTLYCVMTTRFIIESRQLYFVHYGVDLLVLEKVQVLAKSFDIYSNANIHTVMLLPMMLDSATDATAPFFGIAII